MGWRPGTDEELLFRITVKFATGVAPAVAGSRWFRDPQRNDIQDELDGWSAGPVFAPHTTGDQAARRTGRGLLGAVQVIANLVANVGGAAGSPLGSAAGGEKPEEPENEVHDFPVMWAAPSTLARTVPWQLDPGRQPDGYHTDLALTNRRLLFLGVRGTNIDEQEVLAEFSREAISRAQKMKFSRVGADVRITFSDRSWVRLFTGNSNCADRIAGILSGSEQAMPESFLSEGQRRRVAQFIAGHRDATQRPVYIKLNSGIVFVEAYVPSKAGKDLVNAVGILMDDAGEPAQPQPGDL
ncbi:hypothetical protein [Streptomyces justiciae]|uniref:Uncharacterized protein n=1 Tax=Streptomyces justiciae TaxID=2780140 RepID=A0ABU3LWY6_9ACTN|nr:hypothetical protein [Streptomyces justiciae]MDT7843751.1 hypothetical protein [Streptomyces justiciae]